MKGKGAQTVLRHGVFPLSRGTRHLGEGHAQDVLRSVLVIERANRSGRCVLREARAASGSEMLSRGGQALMRGALGVGELNGRFGG
jgi:hypothetical protein